MQFMPWSEELEIGVGEIDVQHQWLVSLTNQLHDHLNNGALNAELISDCLSQLIDYTMNHFIAEEELFTRLGYPDAPAHVALHNSFTQQVMQLYERHESGDAVGHEAVELLKNWLINHITKVDKAYVDYFHAHNISVQV